MEGLVSKTTNSQPKVQCVDFEEKTLLCPELMHVSCDKALPNLTPNVFFGVLVTGATFGGNTMGHSPLWRISWLIAKNAHASCRHVVDVCCSGVPSHCIVNRAEGSPKAMKTELRLCDPSLSDWI